MAGDPAELAITGTFNEDQLGDILVAGSAQFVGVYGLVLVEGAQQSPNPASWTVTEHEGDFAVRVNFEDGAVEGGSSDDRLVFSRSGEDAFGGDCRGEVTFDGKAGEFGAQMDIDDIIGTLSGDSDTYFYAGGFATNAGD